MLLILQSYRYFENIATSFEKQMQTYRQQIEQLERHLLSLTQPYALTPNGKYYKTIILISNISIM